MQDGENKGKITSKRSKKVTKEELNMISQGKRPEWMDREQFVNLRKNVKRIEKEYLKGKYLYISSRLTEAVDELTGVKSKRVETYPPFKRTTLKVLGRNGKV